MTEQNKLRKIRLTPEHDEGWAFDSFKLKLEIKDTSIHGYFSIEKGEHCGGIEYLHFDLALFNLKNSDVWLGRRFINQPLHAEPDERSKLPDYYHPDLLEVKQVIQKILDYDNQGIPLSDWDIEIGGIKLY